MANQKTKIADSEFVCYAKHAEKQPYMMCHSCDGYDKACKGYISKKFNDKITKSSCSDLLDI